MKGHMTGRITTLVVVLVSAIVLGVILGSFTPREGFQEPSPEKIRPANPARRIKTLEEEVADDEEHIEDLRKVLANTVKRLQKLESRNNKPQSSNTSPGSKRSVDDRQTKHIEELREVLANTIRQLRKDDILPGGTACGCASKPVIDPTTGMADATEGCRPPGWMRMMEHESRRNQHENDCPLKHYESSSV